MTAPAREPHARRRPINWTAEDLLRGLRYKPRDAAAYIAARDRYRMDDPREQLDAARKRYHQARKGLEEAQDAAGHFTRRHDIPHENIALREVGAALEQLSIACERCKAEGL